MTVPLGSRRRNGRHAVAPGDAETLAWAQSLREAPVPGFTPASRPAPRPGAVPAQPSRPASPVRPGPALTAEQRAALEARATLVQRQPPADLRRVRDGLRNLAPVRPRPVPAPRRTPDVYAARIDALLYPPSAAADDRDYSAQYAELSRRISRLTGTRSPLENTETCRTVRGGQCDPAIGAAVDRFLNQNDTRALDYDAAEARFRAARDGDRRPYGNGRAA